MSFEKLFKAAIAVSLVKEVPPEIGKRLVVETLKDIGFVYATRQPSWTGATITVQTTPVDAG